MYLFLSVLSQSLTRLHHLISNKTASFQTERDQKQERRSAQGEKGILVILCMYIIPTKSVCIGLTKSVETEFTDSGFQGQPKIEERSGEGGTNQSGTLIVMTYTGGTQLAP